MKNAIKSIAAGALSLLLGTVVPSTWAGTLTEMTGFGSNPGNLRMFKYIPEDLPANRPLVVALHGCTQSASAYDDETGWTKFAEKRRFALLLPEQQSINNFNRCFNWFERTDTTREQGEALSIKQMIDKMKADHAIDPARTYVTGLSAGGAMTAVMLATYPDLFAGGAIVAGLPYRCATGLLDAFTCMNPGRNLSPSQWGRLVRDASAHTGPWPRVSIWHGSADTTVIPVNAVELVDQWTNVHGIDRDPDGQGQVKGHAHQVYKDTDGSVRVETYTINGMAHGTPIDPGPGADQCGTPGAFILDADICSSFLIARFWKLDEAPTPPMDLRGELLERIDRLREELDELRSIVEQRITP